MCMSISLGQGILLSLMAFIVAWDKRWESFFIFRPIMVCTFAGIILNDVQLGLKTGAIAELSCLGLLTVGGTVPPDPLMTGLMTTVIAYQSNSSAETALGLSLPFALLMQWFLIAQQSLASVVNTKIEEALAKQDIKKFVRLVFTPDLFMTVGYAIITFFSAYVMQDAITAFVNSFPEFITHGFDIAGGLLPAVGLGLLLKTMVKAENVPFLVFGFVAMTLLQPDNVLPIALVAAGVAILVYWNDVKMEKLENSKMEVNDNDGI